MRLNTDTLVEESTPESITQLDALIDTYGVNNDQKNDLDKIVKVQNAEIKKLMSEGDLTVRDTGMYKATISVTEKSDFDEEKLLALIHKDPTLALRLIKTKEYVDSDALESAIYRGEIDKDMLVKMNDCKVTKQTVTLRVTKKKAKKGEK